MVKKFIDGKELIRSLIVSLIVVVIFFLMAGSMFALEPLRQVLLYAMVVVAIYAGSFIKVK